MFGAADPPGHREAAIGEVLEEREVREQPRHGDQPPARRLGELLVDDVEARNAGAVVQPLEDLDELGAGVLRDQ
ncbi:hypothetical protein D3C83_217440 [compost metagenome]